MKEINHNIGRGTILLSSPLLTDPNFKRTAILLLEGNHEDGHIGLVLNRPLQLSLTDVCDMPGSADKLPVYSGGPVDLQRLFWIHTLGDLLPGAVEILPGLYVGGDYDALVEMFAKGKNLSDKIRFFLGYSGWGDKQLADEVQQEAWGVLPHLLNPHLLFDYSGDDLWQQLCIHLGPSYRHWGIIPADPSMN